MPHSQLIRPTTGALDVAQLLHEAERLRNHLIAEQVRLQTDFPHLRVSYDARLTCLPRLQNVLDSFYLGCSFWATYLLSDSWWQSWTNCVEADRPILRRGFQQFLRLGLIHLSFSSVESSLRVFMRARDPVAHANATAEFKRIYDDLLMRRLSLPKPGSVELLDMAARMRSTVHNNGIYFHKSGLDVDQTYKGRIYAFRIGKPVKFVGWPLILEIISDLGSLVVDIARDPAIARIKTEILDPSS